MEKAKILPHNLEAEQSVLGCAFLSVEAQINIFTELSPEDFYTKAHQKIFFGMHKCYRENRPIDYITVTRALEEEGVLEEVGGINYIVTLTHAVPSAANHKHYIDIVNNDSMLRRLIDASQGIIATAFDTQSARDSLAHAEKVILDISNSKATSALTHISSGVTEVISRMEKLAVDKNAYRGLKTGFKKFDSYTNGLQKGDLVLLAARPGIGKTSLAMNICENCAVQSGATVAVFSLEMPIRQIASRALSSIGYVPLTDINSGTNLGANNATSANTWDCILESGDRLKKSKIYVDDSSLIKPTEILSKCRKLKREHGLDLVMIDYLQLLTGDSSRSKENRTTEIGEITRMLKVAARELDVPILVLSQLSRAIESRADKTPMLSDLRESGSIEQDADIVLFINRTNPTGEDVVMDKNAEQECSLVIAKHRNGPVGSVPLIWSPKYVKFGETDSRPFGAQRVVSQKENVVMTKVSDSDPF